MKKLFAMTLFLVSSMSFAQDLKSPVGRWKTFRDGTDTPRSIVRIEEVNGVLEGYVEKSFPQEGEPAEPVCQACTGEFKDKPIIGMKFLWGFKKEGALYTGGQILDPKNGKIYKCKMEVLKDGKELNVRGYIGVSLFGRTQTWKRE